MSHPINSIVFITLPENHHFASSFSGFDASIPLPVQLAAPDSEFEVSSLTEEMVLAGILTVLAYDADNAQLEYYRSLLRTIKPNIREEMTEAAILKIKNGDFDLAEEILRALHGLDPHDAVTILNLALLMDERADNMRQSGLDDEAEMFDSNAFNFYRLAMAAEPPLPEAFFNAGFFYLKQKNYRKAKATFESYLKLDTAETESATTRKEKARAILERITDSDLDDELFKSAFDFINMGQEEKALEQIRLFMEHHPKVWNAWFILGWALRRLERWEDARQDFIQALELGKQPDSGIEAGYVDLCNELALCLMELNEIDESRSWLLAALEQEPENTKIIDNLGMVSFKQGKFEEAAGFFRTVLEIDPKDRLAQEMLSKIDI